MTISPRSRKAADSFAPNTALRWALLTVAVAFALAVPATAAAADPSLRAAYGFNEGAGATVADVSDHGNTGTVGGATWTTAGRFGGALSFDGADDMVTVPDADSLDLTNGMTLEAWVRPNGMTGYDSVIMKEGAAGLAYALYGQVSSGRPSFFVLLSRLRGISGPTSLPNNQWSHLAATFDGANLRLYVNGTQVAVDGRSGAVAPTTGALRIGGTILSSEFYKGDIDEVRVYSRALTAGEIQTDMNTAIDGAADTTPPTAPGGFAATSASPNSISTSWTASTDDRGVERYHLFRGGQEVGSSTSTSFTFEDLDCSTSYQLGVEARDAAGNASPRTPLTASTQACDTAPPAVSVTAPGAGTQVTGTATVTADAADNDAVAGVQFLVDGQPIGEEDTSTPYSVAWNSRSVTNGAHTLTARARDRSGNERTSNGVNVTVQNAFVPPPPGMVAGYGFDEGTGTTVADNSANGNTGTISGAGWTSSGRFGSALTFDGFDDLVTIADADMLDLTTAMTLEAWVRPTQMGGYRTVIMKEAATALDYALYSDTSAARPRYQVQVNGQLRGPSGPAQLPAGEWTHLAATYDGAVLRLYVNGSQVASETRTGARPVSNGPLRIGGTLIYPEYFKGDIDEVRVYNRALTASEVVTDMNTAVAGTPDMMPPSAPTGFGPTATGPTSIATSWTASTDDRGVERYVLYRNGQEIDSTTLTSFTFQGLSCSTSYQLGVEARDAAGNASQRTLLNASTQPCDTALPTVSLTAPAAGAQLSGTVSVTANAADNDAVAGVQFLLDGQPLGDEDTTPPYSVPWNTRSATNGPHALSARARDRSNNQRTSAGVNVTVDNVAVPPPDGLVAGYGLDEGNGTTAADASGNGNDGAISGATWRTEGRIGAALSFDGVDDMVTVPDAGSLDLTTGMTLSAWVNPDQLNGAWRTVLFKDGSGDLVYGLYAQEGAALPAGSLSVGGAPRILRGTSQLPLSTWSHLAYTYDGATERLYVDGTLVANVARSGSIATSNGALRIGRNTHFGEAFRGLIDELRVYDRALSQAEIQADMDTSVATPDTQSPSAPSNLAASGSIGRATLNWTAATDNVGVTRYNVHRATSPGFQPTTANRIAQPTTTSYADSGLAAATYYYKVTAQDRAGNVGPASNEANAVVTADTTQPNVAVTAPANGATLSDSVEVRADASDNDVVAGVQFLLDGAPLGAEDTSAPYVVDWNTRLSSNAPHILTARARDASGNTRTSSQVNVTVNNTAAPPPPGLVAGYGFNEGTGGSAADASGRLNHGAVNGATWVPIGRIGGALSFDGVNDTVDVADAGSLDLTTGMTVSAWIRPDSIGTAWRTLLFKERPGQIAYGIYANAGGSGQVPSAEITVGSSVPDARGTTKVPDGVWTHLAATYDGANLRLFVNGSQAGTRAVTGQIATSSNPLRIGGNTTWGEYYDGLIDEVRVYNRPLAATEIQTDMITGVASDTKAPTVTSVAPANGSTGVGVGPAITATFSEAMDASSITTDTFVLRDSANAVVPATVTYDAATGKATLRSTSALRFDTQYTATVEGGTSGPRARDMAGNALAADRVWSFRTEPTPPPVLLLTSGERPYSRYAAELLRAEGLNGFAVNDVSLVDAAFLASFDVVVLGDVPLTTAQTNALSSWVTAGGNLIALRPDKKLAGLLGLADAGTTLANAYMRVQTGAAPGAGIVGETMQFHGTADRYTLNGATAVATLYSNASTATSNPAVTLRSVGSNGGQAAAFTYDLARSVSLTRQGNPAWSGTDRDGFHPIRTNDLFFGGSEPNWIDLSKIHIPQADEQQRLLANLITEMNRDRTPVPRFWYLPRDEKAAIVMTGDDHADGGTAGRFNHYKAVSPPGCSVTNWECVRSTSYIYAPSPITNSQVAGFEADGFEVALHPSHGGCTNFTFAEYDELYTEQLGDFANVYPGAPAPTTSRFHCVSWSDFDSHAKVQIQHGIRLDTNYYHFPPSWGTFPGYMTGSGEIMKFADRDGNALDLYQAHTHLNDEAMDEDVGQVGSAVTSLLNWATGSQGFYGLLTANMHTDDVDSDGSDAIVAAAQARDVPIISSRQALRWVDGRDSSSFREFTWSGGRLGFTVAVGSGANGLRGMLPVQSSAGPLTSLTRDGSPVTLTSQTIKGVQYGFFPATAGRYEARYGS
jgi:Concanavalin A-like lectin/glucanases superfamily/Bacterial Ig-like domain/Bacterial Ig domain